MKILAVNGSPTKKKGMTHIMMELFVKGAMEDFFPDHAALIKEAVYNAGKELASEGCFQEDTLKAITDQPVSAEDHLEQANVFWGM